MAAGLLAQTCWWMQGWYHRDGVSSSCVSLFHAFLANALVHLRPVAASTSLSFHYLCKHMHVLVIELIHKLARTHIYRRPTGGQTTQHHGRLPVMYADDTTLLSTLDDFNGNQISLKPKFHTNKCLINKSNGLTNSQ